MVKRKLPLPDLSGVAQTTKKPAQNDLGVYSGSIYFRCHAILDGFDSDVWTPIRESEQHISISRPLRLRLHHIRPILDRLRFVVHQFHMITVELGPNVEVFLNPEESKAFLGVLCCENEALLSLIQEIDRILVDYRQDCFFEHPQPHVSVAWSESTTGLDPNHKYMASVQRVCLNTLTFKIGNRIYEIPLEEEKL